jgi:hypothetical protein
MNQDLLNNHIITDQHVNSFTTDFNNNNNNNNNFQNDRNVPDDNMVKEEILPKNKVYF